MIKTKAIKIYHSDGHYELYRITKFIINHGELTIVFVNNTAKHYPRGRWTSCEVIHYYEPEWNGL